MVKYIIGAILATYLSIIVPITLAEAPKPVEVQKPVETVSVQTPLTKNEQMAIYKSLIEEEFGKGHVMVRIADAESDYCMNPINKSSSARGCFQILRGTWRDYGCVGDYSDESIRMNVKLNIACARIIYDRDGTVPWNESKHVWNR